MRLTGNRFHDIINVKVGENLKLTIKDIALMAGVSKATVSRVLNDSKPVSEDIRKKVINVIEETNFQPSQVARSLINKETKLIGVIIPDVSNPVFSKIIQGVEQEAIKNGYNVLLCNSRYLEEAEIDYLDILRDKEVDGLVYHGFKTSEKVENKLKVFNKPIVLVGINSKKLKLPVIMIDNEKASYEATMYLIKLGHSKIAMIHGPLDDPFAGALRYKGYVKAMKEKKLEIYKELLVEGHYKLKDGYKGMTKILTSKEIPTAVICANDEMAIGAIKCAIDNEMKVPDEISFIGFDNIEISEIYSPSVTTISQPFESKGKSAMELLIKMIKGEKTDEVIIHSHELIIRETTKNIASNMNL